MEDIKKLLNSSGEETVAWLEHLECIGEPDVEVILPPAEELPPSLLQLEVPHEDINELLTMLPTRQQSPQLWWLLERCAYSLVRDMGAVDTPRNFRPLPESLGELHRYFYVYVFLAVLPHVRAYHRERNIPDEISWLTLADLGRHMSIYRRRHGSDGFEAANWLALHFRGTLYQLGRLQFHLTKLGHRIGQVIAAAGLPYGPGDPALAVHIPDFYGRLTPKACNASLTRAKEFFARHFPEDSYEIATCGSWLLDEQLAEYLPADANIIAFQRRFQLVPATGENDENILSFVFGTKAALDNLDRLPRRTTLQRAVIDHLKAGRHWQPRSGWLQL